MTFKHSGFVKRDYEATNIVACVSDVAPRPEYVPADESILAGLTRLWIETVNGHDVAYWGYL